VAQVYVPHPIYRVVAGLCLVLAVLLAGQVLRVFTPAALLFCVISLAIALWCLGESWCQVELHPTSFCVTLPLRPAQWVEFHQLISVTENGRLNPVITVVYHPRLDNGLLDLEAVRSLLLPAVTEQETLLAHLQARLPV
jgi:hypothetical protein